MRLPRTTIRLPKTTVLQKTAGLPKTMAARLPLPLAERSAGALENLEGAHDAPTVARQDRLRRRIVERAARRHQHEDQVDRPDDAVAAGHDPMNLKRGIDAAVKVAVESLHAQLRHALLHLARQLLLHGAALAGEEVGRLAHPANALTQ